MGLFKLVVGLGNPGPEYESTRHNAGFMVIDELARRIKAGRFKKAYKGQYAETEFPEGNTRIGLLKPLTFMNRSGASVAAAMRDHSIGSDDLIVIHDDLDIPLGRIKVKVGGGAGGHKGIASILGLVESPEFVRVRIGVDRPNGKDAADYVLERFRMDERVIFNNESLPRTMEAVRDIIVQGVEKAMNIYNRQ